MYDDNKVTIEGSTDITFSEDRGARFEAYGWHVQHVADGSSDVDGIDAAIKRAKEDPRPSIILCRTHLGYGFPNMQDDCAIHGAPPGYEELNAAKKLSSWPLEPMFYIPEDAKEFFLLRQLTRVRRLIRNGRQSLLPIGLNILSWLLN